MEAEFGRFIVESEIKYPINARRAMIIGGGGACKMLLTEIFNAQKSPYKDDKYSAQFNPVCIIDNDPEKIGKDVLGVKVVGKSDDIVKYAREYDIEQLILAIPSLTSDERKGIIDLCNDTKLPLKIVPFIGTLILDDKSTLLGQVRDIKVEELLGRDPIKFDNKDIRDFISGKVCMVTGGGGSIGSELVRQIAKYNPERVIIVDIYENNAYEIQQELVMEYGEKLDLVTLIASVRDYYRMNQILRSTSLRSCSMRLPTSTFPSWRIPPWRLSRTTLWVPSMWLLWLSSMTQRSSS